MSDRQARRHRAAPLPDSSGEATLLAAAEPGSPRVRLQIELTGAVQGVGFRPFVYRLAVELGLAGWVVNDMRGVVLEVEGPRAAIETFRTRLIAEKPARARIHRYAERRLAAAGLARFAIRESRAGGERSATPLPDLATCPECLAEVFDPGDRRHRYPFANCTRCGPRFTILRALPYDRPNTTMAGFGLCDACRAEYGNPLDRRFHAQPVACPACGPRLALTSRSGAATAYGDDALRTAAIRLRAGEVVAVKGLGGYHLMCDAAAAAALARLRAGKPRLEKPFALMVRDLDQARALCRIDDDAAAALVSAEAPILLLPRRPEAPVAAAVAPGYPTLGLMLPATPLHHLLLREVGRPVVATSGNRSEEPIVTGDAEARERLGDLADAWLAHDRPIERPVDDSVGWMIDGAFALLRRARGWAPLPIRVRRGGPVVLAVGGHAKSAVALALGDQVFVSQHLGDLETPQAADGFERAIADLLTLHEVVPAAIAHDLHPDYASTRWAVRAVADGVRLVPVQHHHAHLASCLAEHGAEGPALGVVWDGAGLGPDGTIWGGEFLWGDARGCERVACFTPFRLPGGDAAAREPRRSALALLWELLGPAALERDDLAVVRAFAPEERTALAAMLARGVHAPWTTSAGRLFDAFAALTGFAGRVAYEGQAAAMLEFAVDPDERGGYPLPCAAGSRDGVGAAAFRLDWRPALAAALEDLARGENRCRVAARFHRALIGGIAAVARETGARRVALSGGCFQNRRLVEGAAARLRADRREVLAHRDVPPNDGGLALGQAAIARAVRERP